MAESIFVEDFEQFPWVSSREFIKITDPAKFDTGPVDDEYYSKWRFKIFRIDPITKGATRALIHAPGWEEPNFGYHLHTEEAFRLYGEGRTPDESYSGGVQYNISKAGTYTYRPPGWVHDGATLLESMVYLSNDGPATHQVATKEMVGKNAMYPDDLTKAIGPRGYINRLNTPLLPWIQVTNSDKKWFLKGHSNAGKVYYKPLSRDVYTGAETLLVKYGVDYSESDGGLTSGVVEIFVLEGGFKMFNKRFGKYGYAYVPKGQQVGSLESKEGTTFLVKSTNGDWFHSNDKQ